MLPAPKVDSRTAREIAAQVHELLPHYVKGWRPHNSGAAEALTGIFARYCEIIIDRLNKTPEKNLLAFLNLIGNTQAPAQPARVPLTFYLAAQCTAEAIVPALTQVAALPAKGETEPVLFETEQDLVVAPARLDALWVRDDVRDLYADYSDLLDQTALPPPTRKIGDPEFIQLATLHFTGQPPSADEVAAFVADTATDKRPRAIERLLARGVPMFRGNRPFEHALFIAIEPVSSAAVWNELRLRFVLTNDIPSRPDALHESPLWQIEWEIWNGGTGILLTPVSDSTQNLTKSGEVVFAGIPQPPPSSVNGSNGHWLRVSWKALAGSTNATPAPIGPLPIIQEIAVTVETEQKAQRLERAFLNNIPLDLSKDFFPLGDRPKFGDTLYLSSSVFSAPNAEVTLFVELTNPASGGGNPPIPPVKPAAPKLQWEVWDGVEWNILGVSEWSPLAPSQPTPRLRIDPQNAPPPERVPASSFTDTTQAFVQSGQVSFHLPNLREKCSVGGQPGYWIRVRLISGDYGHESRYELEPGKGYVITPATFAPPVIRHIQVEQSLKVESAPAAVISYNDFAYRDVTGQPFAPFVIGAEPQPCCYLGLQPMNGQFPGRSMSFYFGLINTAAIDVEIPDAVETTDAVGTPNPEGLPIIWEYWNGKTWTPRTVQDDTGGLRHSGLIQFLAPADFSARAEFGFPRFWLRARKVSVAFEPRVRRILLNTTMASQTQTTANEILGSGTGKPNQIFRTARKPVLQGQILDVLEPSPPSVAERGQIEREEGPDAIVETAPTPAGRIETWVRWHEMPNFEGSGPRDRHYVMNRDAGEVIFGDGVRGLAPPVLTGSVRMTKYQTGGGATGNKPAAAIAQMKTTVPYVERVTNFVAADGGADVETVAEVLERAPRAIRHGDRAVTGEDFEDLALRASSEVARAKCLPLCDLETDREGKTRCPGVISLILVPRWAASAVNPLPPSAELFGRVREFLDARRLRAVKLVLAAPDYICISIKTEITVVNVDTASAVELAATLALSRFLHPLTGRDGNGWEFGRLPAKSDLYAVIEKVPGVEHVRSIQMSTAADPADAERIGRFLIYAGDVQVTATLER